MNYKTIIILFTFTLIASCASIPTELEELDRTLFAYERALRWQNYDTVIAFHKNEHSTLTQEKRKHLKQFRVTAYDEVYRSLGRDAKSATQVVEVKYYTNEYAVIRNITLKNQWEFEEKSGRWFLSNPLPAFK